MSRPISQCWISQAAFGDEKALQGLIEAMDYNNACGHYSTFTCTCTPPCPKPSEEQIVALNQKVKAGIAELVKARIAKARPLGTFDKIVFPVIKNMPAGDLNQILHSTPSPFEPVKKKVVVRLAHPSYPQDFDVTPAQARAAFDLLHPMLPTVAAELVTLVNDGGGLPHVGMAERGAIGDALEKVGAAKRKLATPK